MTQSMLDIELGKELDEMKLKNCIMRNTNR